MNVYDFDNTIYDGESVIDFYIFCLFRKPTLVKYLPLSFVMLARYKMGFVSLEELEKKAVKYVGEIVEKIDNLPVLIKEFWDKNQHKIKDFYLKKQKPDDVIISASCDFLIEEIAKRLGIKNCLSSKINLKTGEVIRLCFRSNKPEIFKSNFQNSVIDEFYTDSMNDLPMIMLSRKAYLVKKNKIIKLKKEDFK